MEVDDAYIPDETFAAFVAACPLVAVELVLETADGILLARRANEPAKGEWFWPGSRLYKGERTQDAAHRVANEELGIEIDIIGQLGIYEHFWETSSVEGSPPYHTVNVVYRGHPASDGYEIVLDDQHSDHRYLTEVEPGLHEYVRRYLVENDLL